MGCGAQGCFGPSDVLAELPETVRGPGARAGCTTPGSTVTRVRVRPAEHNPGQGGLAFRLGLEFGRAEGTSLLCSRSAGPWATSRGGVGRALCVAGLGASLPVSGWKQHACRQNREAAGRHCTESHTSPRSRGPLGLKEEKVLLSERARPFHTRNGETGARAAVCLPVQGRVGWRRTSSLSLGAGEGSGTPGLSTRGRMMREVRPLLTPLSTAGKLSGEADAGPGGRHESQEPGTRPLGEEGQ